MNSSSSDLHLNHSELQNSYSQGSNIFRSSSGADNRLHREYARLLSEMDVIKRQALHVRQQLQNSSTVSAGIDDQNETSLASLLSHPHDTPNLSTDDLSKVAGSLNRHRYPINPQQYEGKVDTSYPSSLDPESTSMAAVADQEILASVSLELTRLSQNLHAKNKQLKQKEAALLDKEKRLILREETVENEIRNGLEKDLKILRETLQKNMEEELIRQEEAVEKLTKENKRLVDSNRDLINSNRQFRDQLKQLQKETSEKQQQIEENTKTIRSQKDRLDRLKQQLEQQQLRQPPSNEKIVYRVKRVPIPAPLAQTDHQHTQTDWMKNKEQATQTNQSSFVEKNRVVPSTGKGSIPPVKSSVPAGDYFERNYLDYFNSTHFANDENESEDVFFNKLLDDLSMNCVDLQKVDVQLLSERLAKIQMLGLEETYSWICSALPMAIMSKSFGEYRAAFFEQTLVFMTELLTLSNHQSKCSTIQVIVLECIFNADQMHELTGDEKSLALVLILGLTAGYPATEHMSKFLVELSPLLKNEDIRTRMARADVLRVLFAYTELLAASIADEEADEAQSDLHGLLDLLTFMETFVSYSDSLVAVAKFLSGNTDILLFDAVLGLAQRVQDSEPSTRVTMIESILEKFALVLERLSIEKSFNRLIASRGQALVNWLSGNRRVSIVPSMESLD